MENLAGNVTSPEMLSTQLYLFGSIVISSPVLLVPFIDISLIFNSSVAVNVEYLHVVVTLETTSTGIELDFPCE